jgi:protein-L-isoaspartate(D-aspartate) O-methyltransferase
MFGHHRGLQPDRWEAERRAMVERQIRARGVGDERVLEAMRRVPREQFVSPEAIEVAYEDCALPIGWGQTISQPFTVAYMLQALLLKGTEKVLEVGTGSGYGAAVLSLLAREVHTVERLPQLADQASLKLKQLGYANVHVHVGDGSLGWQAESPFDAIVVTAAAEFVPPPYESQLVIGGRLVLPVGDITCQSLVRLMRTPGGCVREDLGGFMFVPLIGEYGFSYEALARPQ